MTTSNHRHTDLPIDPLFLDRWSPRAFTGEAISDETLLTILDAARWAPSAGNGQPWRFIYARRGTEAWPALLQLLDEGNQRWAQNAGALIILVSRTHSLSTSTGERRAIYTHAFDTGAAWMALAMQTMKLGLHAHGMGGLDRNRAMAELGIPEKEVIERIMLGETVDKEFTTVEDVAEVAFMFAAFPTNALTGQALNVSHGWNMA